MHTVDISRRLKVIPFFSHPQKVSLFQGLRIGQYPIVLPRCRQDLKISHKLFESRNPQSLQQRYHRSDCRQFSEWQGIQFDESKYFAYNPRWPWQWSSLFFYDFRKYFLKQTRSFAMDLKIWDKLAKNKVFYVMEA